MVLGRDSSASCVFILGLAAMAEAQEGKQEHTELLKLGHRSYTLTFLSHSPDQEARKYFYPFSGRNCQVTGPRMCV